MAHFKELIEAARSTGELSEGDAQYVLGLWEASDDGRENAKLREVLRLVKVDLCDDETGIHQAIDSALGER